MYSIVYDMYFMNSGSIFSIFFFSQVPLNSGKIAVYDLFFIYETNFIQKVIVYYKEVGGREQRRDATAPLR